MKREREGQRKGEEARARGGNGEKERKERYDRARTEGRGGEKEGEEGGRGHD